MEIRDLRTRIRQIKQKSPFLFRMAADPNFFGGAIGSVYAVIAYLLNLKIYISELTRLNKVLANLLCGMSAISAWWFSAQWILGNILLIK